MHLVSWPTLIAVDHQDCVTQADGVVPVPDGLRWRCGVSAARRGIEVEVDSGQRLIDVRQTDVQQAVEERFQHRCQRGQAFQLVERGLSIALLARENLRLLLIENVAFDGFERERALPLFDNVPALAERDEGQEQVVFFGVLQTFFELFFSVARLSYFLMPS